MPKKRREKEFVISIPAFLSSFVARCVTCAQEHFQNAGFLNMDKGSLPLTEVLLHCYVTLRYNNRTVHKF
jgi:hypothetical protein